MAAPKIKRLATGDGRIDAFLINWANWIEYAVNLNGAFPVKVTRGSAGPMVSVDLPPAPFIGIVTTAVTAGSGTGSTVGSGVVTKAKFSGSALTADSSETGIPVSNYHEKGFTLSSVVWCVWANGVYWVIDVGKCTGYGP